MQFPILWCNGYILFVMLVGVVKCISSDYHLKWLAVGSSNDIISTLDPRTGEVFASWKTSEFSVSSDTIYTLVITISHIVWCVEGLLIHI